MSLAVNIALLVALTIALLARVGIYSFNIGAGAVRSWVNERGNRFSNVIAAWSPAKPCPIPRSGCRLESIRRQVELSGNRRKAFTPFPLAEHVVYVLQAAEQLDGRRVVDVDIRAQERALQRNHTDVHVGRHGLRPLADVANGHAFHGGHVIACLDEAADGTTAAITAICTAAVRQQRCVALAKQVKHGTVEDFLVR